MRTGTSESISGFLIEALGYPYRIGANSYTSAFCFPIGQASDVRPGLLRLGSLWVVLAIASLAATRLVLTDTLLRRR